MTDFFLTLLTVGMVWAWTRSSRVAPAPESSDERSIIRQALTGHTGAERGLQALGRWMARCQSRTEKLKDHLPAWHELGPAEKELIDCMLKGMTPKEIAQLRGVSTLHIYNLRSHVRKKLNVPKHQDLVSFLRHQAGQDPITHA
jgi:DNA-binding CsgD family transcriptional regulator